MANTKCVKCNGTGKVSHYYDTGDHFGAGSSPFSEWEEIPCSSCSCIKCGKPNKFFICQHCGKSNDQHDDEY